MERIFKRLLQLFDDRGRVQCVRETMCGIDQSLLEWEGCCNTLRADTRKLGITWLSKTAFIWLCRSGLMLAGFGGPLPSYSDTSNNGSRSVEPK